MHSGRVRAPELRGDVWFNTEIPLTLTSLRGRVVLLDFWTSGCVNCLHVADELRSLEHRLGERLVVIGIHSPKFSHESTPSSVGAAVARNGITHPVVSDPDMYLWQQYAVHAWPTLVLIDQQGYVVAQAAGEGQVSSLGMLIDTLLASDTLPASATPVVSSQQGVPRRVSLLGGHDSSGGSGQPVGLQFPAKAIALPSGSLLVADAGQHRLTEISADGTVLRHIGSGVRGHLDGTADRAQFAEPNGLTLLPSGVADYDVVVADTVNHALRGVRLSDGAVVTTIDLAAKLAGTLTVTGGIPSALSPWDVVWWPSLQQLVVAAAGVHLLLRVDPRTGTTAVLAGTTVEGLGDGPALDGWLAQPSGLAVDGDRLWFVDAETSALRYLTDGQLHTVVGEGLFDWGFTDGPAGQARLQHPLDVQLLPDSSLAIADTYNGAVRGFDPQTRQLSTLARGLAEPSGLVIDADGQLSVIESAAHRVTVVSTQQTYASGELMKATRPATAVPGGTVRLQIRFELPPGRTLDTSYGPATRLSVSASPAQALLTGAGEGSELVRELRFADGMTDAVLHVSAQAASCDDGAENPACYLARQDWGVPLVFDAHADPTLRLVLLG